MPTPAPAGNGCQADPAPVIEALPAGATFFGSGCYNTYGIVISRPLTIIGGTYDDPATLADRPAIVLPIIRVRNTSHVTIEDVALNGQNPKGFHRHMVGEAGLDILSSDHVRIINVSTDHTFGDGMTLFSEFSFDKNPVTHLYVNGLTVMGAGRQGITMGYVKDSTLDNVDVLSSHWDFESDLPRAGSGNITINHGWSPHGVHIVEPLLGPITFNDCHFARRVHLTHLAAASGQLVTFNGGSFELARRSNPGNEVADIVIDGPGRLLMNHVVLTRNPGKEAPKGPAASVTNGGRLILAGGTSLPPPTGSLSGVTVMP